MSNEVLISLIATAGGILGAIISVRWRRKKPKSEYIDTAFEMYEVMVKRLDEENTRLRLENAKQAAEIDSLKRR